MHHWLSGGLFAVLLFASSGCITGDRPTLAAETSTGYADVDGLIDRVAGLSEAKYTAHYELLVRYGNTTRNVSASQSAGDRRSLTIGDVRYIVHGQVTKTCMLSTGTCTNRIDPGRVSDVLMTPDFFGTNMVARIELDASRAIAQPTTTSEETEAGRALCVAIQITGGATSTYCAVESGVVTRLDAPDLAVTMTDYRDEVDETLYAEGTPS